MCDEFSLVNGVVKLMILVENEERRIIGTIKPLEASCSLRL